MSRLKQFHELENTLKNQMAQFELLKKQKDIVTELEFEKKLLLLMKEYEKDFNDTMAILNWHLAETATTLHEEKPVYGSDPT
jgi:hypothetical protein